MIAAVRMAVQCGTSRRCWVIESVGRGERWLWSVTWGRELVG